MFPVLQETGSGWLVLFGRILMQAGDGLTVPGTGPATQSGDAALQFHASRQSRPDIDRLLLCRVEPDIRRRLDCRALTAVPARMEPFFGSPQRNQHFRN